MMSCQCETHTWFETIPASARTRRYSRRSGRSPAGSETGEGPTDRASARTRECWFAVASPSDDGSLAAYAALRRDVPGVRRGAAGGDLCARLAPDHGRLGHRKPPVASTAAPDRRRTASRGRHGPVAGPEPEDA